MSVCQSLPLPRFRAEKKNFKTFRYLTFCLRFLSCVTDLSFLKGFEFDGCVCVSRKNSVCQISINITIIGYRLLFKIEANLLVFVIYLFSTIGLWLHEWYWDKNFPNNLLGIRSTRQLLALYKVLNGVGILNKVLGIGCNWEMATNNQCNLQYKA